MRQNRQNRVWLLVAAAAMAFPICDSAAHAQARVDTSGRALDANTRIGSGGFNSTRDNTAGLNNELVVTGNITGGREFRGPTASTLPRAFRGNLATAGIDRFVRQSSGPSGFNATTVRPYIGQSYGAAPPPGFVQQGQTGGFVPAPPPRRQGMDLRLGSVFDTPQFALPKPGDLVLAGPLDPSNNNTLIAASPLFGVRQLNAGDAADVIFLNRYTGATGDRNAGRADTDALRRMQEELRDTDQSDQDQRTTSPDQLNSSTENKPLDNSPLASTTNNDALASDATTGQRVGQRLVLTPAVKQSAQYKQLVDRLQKYNEQMKLDQATADNRDYNAQLRKVKEMQAEKEKASLPQLPQKRTGESTNATPDLPGQPKLPGLPGTEKPGEKGDGNAQADLLGPTRTGNRTKPPMIDSLATGVTAKGLAEVLTEAEKLMKERKFVAAMEKYDLAAQVAPNNPMPLFGRANAELGASFYARADNHLRQAFNDSPALMMAQYDLRKFLGEDRLEFLVKDLKEIATQEKDSARPLMLLAYIAYNEGNDRMAAGYLDLAEKRSGGDPFYKTVRDHWQLPPYDGSPSDLNK